MTYEMLDEDLIRYHGKDADVVVPEGVRSIADYAFEGARVVRVTLPSTLQHIGKGVFTGCTLLKEVVVLEGVQELGLSMFPGCSKLERVVIPSTVTSLGGVFDGTRELRAPKAADVAVMPKAVEVMSTKDQINPSLKACLPDDQGVLGHVLAYQNHANWMKALEEKITPENAGEVFSTAVALAAEEEALVSKKATQLVSFGLNHFDAVEAESLVQLHDLLEEGGRKLAKPLNQMDDDPRVAAVLSRKPDGEIDMARSDSPYIKAESKAIGAIVWDRIAQKTRDAVRSGVRYANSDSMCHPSALVYIISEYARQAPERNKIGRSKSDRINYRVDYWDDAKTLADVDAVAELLDRAELCDLLDEMINRANPVAEAIVAYARYADELHVPKLVDIMKGWVKSWQDSDRKSAYIARGALMLNDTKAAMRYFDSIKRLDAYARKRGRDAEELKNEMADFGLDENGSIAFDLGGNTVVAIPQHDMSWLVVDRNSGKQYKSIPKRGADPSKYEAARADFAALKKETKRLFKSTSESLFEDFLSGRSIAVDRWKKTYLGNPVMRVIAGSIVWSQEGATFTVRGGKTIDASGAKYSVGNGEVSVAHPIEMGADDVAAWQDYFTKLSFDQPFDQIGEPVVVGKGKPVKRDRYRGRPIRVRTLMGHERDGLHVTLDGHVTFGEDFQFDIYEGFFDGVDGFYDGCDISADALKMKYVWDDDRYYFGVTEMDIEIVDVAPKRSASIRLLNHVVYTLDRICLSQ